MKQEQLIFIISQPRAGSTALQLQLSKHREINTISEPWILLPLLGLHKSDFISGVYNHKLYLKTQSDLFKNLDNNLYQEALRDFVLAQYGQLIGTAKYFIDKTPRYYEELPELLALFPDASFIILKRHPLDVLKSVIQTWCKNDINNIYQYSRDLILAPQLIYQFENSNRDKNNFHIIKYEDMIQNSKQSLDDIFRFLKIDKNNAVASINPKDVLKGTFGDNKSARQKKDITINEDTWRDFNLITNVKYKKLANAYYKFLGEDFLKQFGGYTCVNHKSSFTRNRIFTNMQNFVSENLKI